jgi:hypothetical protein
MKRKGNFLISVSGELAIQKIAKIKTGNAIIFASPGCFL